MSTLETMDWVTLATDHNLAYSEGGSDLFIHLVSNTCVYCPGSALSIISRLLGSKKKNPKHRVFLHSLTVSVKSHFT